MYFALPVRQIKPTLYVDKSFKNWYGGRDQNRMQIL